MGIAVNLGSRLVNQAKTYSYVQHRSIPKQIEHWAEIGKIAEENPDLSYNAIKEIMHGLADVAAGNVEKYKEDSL